mmetsp:Transcript_871/g.2367  ORF Transcript_871/g.2367 Transcript_871/m.2367 type:complete len:98 (-) Transcript_871:587-880(-)
MEHTMKGAADRGAHPHSAQTKVGTGGRSGFVTPRVLLGNLEYADLASIGAVFAEGGGSDWPAMTRTLRVAAPATDVGSPSLAYAYAAAPTRVAQPPR